MGEEIVTVKAGGEEFLSWKKMTVTAGANEGARSFTLVCAAEGGSAALFWRFKPGTPVEVEANGDLLVRGYAERLVPGLAASEVTISGRSKSADLIDCAAIHDTGDFEGKTPAEIGRELDLFGVGISADAAMEAIDYHLAPGETVYEAIERKCRAQGFSPSGQADGSLKLLGPPNQKHAGALVEGQNLIDLVVTHDWSKRYSDTIGRAQRPFGHDADDLEMEAIAKDAAVSRYRPMVLVVDDDITKAALKKRVEQRRDRQAGNSLKAVATVQGFRDDGGTLWTPGRLIWTESPFGQIAQDMAIENVAWRQDDRGGSTAKLSLVDPRAYGGKKGKAGKSGAAWDIGNADAS